MPEDATDPGVRGVLEDAALRAGAIALAHFRGVAAERKADRTLVTRADREVEAFLADTLGAARPGAGILGEEGTVRAGEGSRWFVIDPIDGTSAFVAGLPTWCICAGLIDTGRPVAGVVHLPCAGELYVAAGGRAWWNGVPLPPLDAGATAGEPFVAVHSRAHRRHDLRDLGKIRSFGSAAYHAVLVARGVARAALLGNVSVWDLAAPAAVLAAVGGSLELLAGGPVALDELLDDHRVAGEVVAGAPAAIRDLRIGLRL